MAAESATAAADVQSTASIEHCEELESQWCVAIAALKSLVAASGKL